MSRPRSILWVDDEVESLTSHILFLQEQGFAVETATHGDDAIVLLQRQNYGVVLLDEQMPGRRGLELFHSIRAMDNALPVVMVTKSEEPDTLRDAIGAEVSDYLTKPVNPRQILSVVTRLLEGDRIRQQRLSRDFTNRFRDLEGRRGAPMAWREWVELVVELAEWEVRLGEADEPGLQDALRTLQDSLRADFAGYLRRNYASWLHDARTDRPPLSVDTGAEIATRYPQWWMDQDEASLNAHEAELLVEQLREVCGRNVPVRYEKVFTSADGESLLKRLPGHLAQDGVTALVFNFIDQLTHGRTENLTLYEVARDASSLRSLTRTWFERSPLWDALREAERRGVPVLLTTDHGSIHCHTPATVFAKRDTTANLRYKFGDDLRAQEADAALVVDDLPSYGLPARAPGTRLLLATGDRFFVYPTKLREYQARYRGAFLHGGVSPEEVILPIALLTPRHG